MPQKFWQNVRYFCPIWNKTATNRQILINIPSSKVHENPFLCPRTTTCGQTDGDTWTNNVRAHLQRFVTALSKNRKMADLVCLLFEGNNFRHNARNIVFVGWALGVFSCSGKILLGAKFTLGGWTSGHKHCWRHDEGQKELFEGQSIPVYNFKDHRLDAIKPGYLERGRRGRRRRKLVDDLNTLRAGDADLRF